jgi:hypothetical protein
VQAEFMKISNEEAPLNPLAEEPLTRIVIAKEPLNRIFEIPIVETPFLTPPLDPILDAFRLFMRDLQAKDKDDQEEFVGNGLLCNIMYIISPNKGTAEYAISKVQCSLSELGDRLPTPEDENRLLLTAQLLHIPLIKLSEIPKAVEEDSEPQEGELISDYHDPEEEDDDDNDNDDDNYLLLDTGAPEADDHDDDESSAASTMSTATSAIPTASPLTDGYVPPHKLLLYIIDNEKWLLPRILYALTTGSSEYELSEHNHALDRSKILASSCS